MLMEMTTNVVTLFSPDKFTCGEFAHLPGSSKPCTESKDKDKCDMLEQGLLESEGSVETGRQGADARKVEDQK